MLNQARDRPVRHGSRGQRIEPRQAAKKRSLGMPGRSHPVEEKCFRSNTRAFRDSDDDALAGLIGLRMGDRQPEPLGHDPNMLDLKRDDLGPTQRRGHADRQDRAITQRSETFAFDRGQHVAQRSRICGTLLSFSRPVFRPNAGQHFGQTPGCRHRGRRRIPAGPMMMPDRRHPPVDC